MKAQVIETELSIYEQYAGPSHKVKMVGYLKTGEHITLVIEDDGRINDSIASKLSVSQEIELNISINTKQTITNNFTLE
jgi:hypothetical protein